MKKLTVMDASYLYLETPEVPLHIGRMQSSGCQRIIAETSSRI
jgi:hypothetical protein